MSDEFIDGFYSVRPFGGKISITVVRDAAKIQEDIQELVDSVQSSSRSVVDFSIPNIDWKLCKPIEIKIDRDKTRESVLKSMRQSIEDFVVCCDQKPQVELTSEQKAVHRAMKFV